MIGHRFRGFVSLALACGLASSVALVAEQAQGQDTTGADDGLVGNVEQPSNTSPDNSISLANIRELGSESYIRQREALIEELNSMLDDLTQMNELAGEFLTRHARLVNRFGELGALVENVEVDCQIMDERAARYPDNPFMDDLDMEAVICWESLGHGISVFQSIDDYLYDIRGYVDSARSARAQFGERSEEFRRSLQLLFDSDGILGQQEGLQEKLDEAINGISDNIY